MNQHVLENTIIKMSINIMIQMIKNLFGLFYFMAVQTQIELFMVLF